MDLIKTSQAPETMSVDVPAEPPPGSVVLDRDGNAWQRTGILPAQQWSTAGLRARPIFVLGSAEGWASWPLLITSRGPLTLIHRDG